MWVIKVQGLCKKPDMLNGREMFSIKKLTKEANTPKPPVKKSRMRSKLIVKNTATLIRIKTVIGLPLRIFALISSRIGFAMISINDYRLFASI